MAKFVALKTFVSALGNYEAGQEYDVKLDKYTVKNWTESELIEPIKAGDVTNENQ